jgi:hypothetical protein
MAGTIKRRDNLSIAGTQVIRGGSGGRAGERRRLPGTTGPRTSVDSNTTRYTHAAGGPTEIEGRFLGFYEKNPILPAEDDILYVVPLEFEGRIDRIAQNFYSDVRYSWVILMRNNIDDPFTELLAGNRIFVPSVTRLFSEILSS